MDSVVPPVELHSLSSALARGDRSLTAYLNELQARFEAIETGVQAFIPEPGRFKRLHASAEKLLSQYLAARTSLPLFGLPVGIKDIFHIDGWITQAGASLPTALLQGPQAASVTRLLKAGALIAGKTVTTEFAYFHPGPTRNPRNLAHTPGGSSSGSAAAVAAGLATLALGTQTIGSIIRPAAYCGVVGYKPSYDRISRDGVIPLAPSVDHVGVFSVDTAGAALAASILCSTWQPAGPAARPVLGIPSGPYLERAGAVAQRYFDAAHRRLAAAGYLVQVRPVMEAFPEIEAAHQTIVAAEASAVHSVWFSQYSALYHPETAALIRRGQGIPDADLQAALDKRLVLRDSLCSLMRTEGIDLWISPAATGPAPFGLESTGDPVMNLPWTFCGLPALTVPAGRDRSGLPLGIQIIGDWYADERLLAWAVDIEDRLKTMEIEDNENSQSNFTGKRR